MVSGTGKTSCARVIANQAVCLQFYPLALFLNCFLNIVIYPLPTEK